MQDDDWIAFTVKSEEPAAGLPDGLYEAQIYRQGNPPGDGQEHQVRKDGGWYWGWEGGRLLVRTEVILRVRRIGDLPD